MSLEAQEREAHRIAVAYANRIDRPNETYSKSIRAERERHYTICLDRAPIASFRRRQGLQGNASMREAKHVETVRAAAALRQLSSPRH